MDDGNKRPMTGSRWKKVADNLYRRDDSPFFYVVWHEHRRKRLKSTKTANLRQAKQFRDSWMARVRSGLRDAAYDELRQLLIDYYSANDKDESLRSLRVVRLKHLDPFFKGHTAERIANTGMISRYIALRKREGAANASINREISALHRMFTLAADDSRRLIDRGLVPRISKLAEKNVRKGFVTVEQFNAILGRLPAHYRPPIAVANITGWRIQEVLSRQRKHVDFSNGFIRLEPHETKNGEGREFPLTVELDALLHQQIAAVEKDQLAMGRVIPWLFHFRGQRIKYWSLYSAWRQARKDAGFPGIIIHDLRRTTARRFESKGIPRTIAMAMMGHLTESVYRRYAIVDMEAMREAAKKL